MADTIEEKPPVKAPKIKHIVCKNNNMFEVYNERYGLELKPGPTWEKEKVGDILKDTSIELAIESTPHGIMRIVRARTTTFQFIWTVLVFCAMGVCAFMIYDSVEKYLKFHVVSNIADISESPTMFPAVSLCKFTY
jgi:hypothetical protein